MNPENNKLSEIMSSALEETFEEMAFLEVCRVQVPDDPPDEGGLLRVSLLVHDPFPGELCLAAPRSLLTEMARILFGTEGESIPDETLLDLQAELLNTIAGRVMREITPEEATFRLGLPETGAQSLSDLNCEAIKCHFSVDEEIVSMTVSGDALLARAETC
ncbi:MAG: chemotaxis protein CheX [Deltaproteobacteria bacterium]|nr:chemotaxis protein CheX [Deltaproteobacteria bacterium]MBW1925511.1 chemotaxis protein CheX [Deltaproteobacteria bacterium]MBW2009721.1 chemotaxis protein CheX [Deltaproteobacteria bacterium]MBW2104189.1 chemotaxis protein CheX [Deltaproteobacteria bacterium]